MASQAIVIGGPTASGKSALAVAVAQACNGVVINADSMQVYREIPILTAQPSPETRQRIPHRLYGFMPITQACSAARWAELARQEIDAAMAAGRLPIVVGGTGLYLKALLEGLAPIPPISAAIRSAAKSRLAGLGNEAFHREVATRDPALAARVSPSDRQRLVRAWEVHEATGRPLSDWQAKERPWHKAAGIRFTRFVVLPDRATLYAACDARLVEMLRQGALDEAKAVQALGLDPELPAMKALGLRDLMAHLGGGVDLTKAVEAAQQATRNYAKRQMTWFRHQLRDANIISPSGEIGQFSARILSEIFNNIRNSG